MEQDTTVMFNDGKAPPKKTRETTRGHGEDNSMGKSGGQKKYNWHSFSTSLFLLKHKHTHKEFACKHCDKTYVLLGALKRHIRTHMRQRKCQICGQLVVAATGIYLRAHRSEAICPNRQIPHLSLFLHRPFQSTYPRVLAFHCEKILQLATQR